MDSSKSSFDTIPIINSAHSFVDQVAVISHGEQFTYGQLLDASGRAATKLLGGETNLAEARIAFLVKPGFEYVATQWGVWRAGGVAVPLAIMHPPAELAYAIEDSDASVVVAEKCFENIARPLAEQRGLRLGHDIHDMVYRLK